MSLKIETFVSDLQTEETMHKRILTDVVEIFYRNYTKATNASALSSSASDLHGNESQVWILSLCLVISLLFSLQTTNSLAL